MFVQQELDLEVISSLREILGLAIVRSTDKGFLYLNTAALELFGFHSFEEAQHFPRRFIYADPDVYHLLKAKLKAYGSIQQERVLLKKTNQSNFWGSVTSIQRIVDGEIVYDEVITNISKEIEKEHRLAEKSHLLEKVSGELDRFVYSASHDLRSPVTTLLGLVALLKMNASAPPPEYLEMMKTSLNKLEAHIRKLVDFAKNTNEQGSCEPIDFNDLIQQTLADLGTHTSIEKISIQKHVVGNYITFSDPTKIKIALSQVLRNAIDYLDANKAKPFVSIRAILQPDLAKIEIVDNGIGIEKEYIPFVCQMFYRATTQSQGSGLGLYVAREALIKIHGSLEIQSEYGVGTSVTITIPSLKRNKHVNSGKQ